MALRISIEATLPDYSAHEPGSVKSISEVFGF